MNNKWLIVVLLCFSLGLAPWWLNDEPHIIGKVKWVLGGAKGMKFMDYFDLVLHGFPWIFLLVKVVKDFVIKKNEPRLLKDK